MFSHLFLVAAAVLSGSNFENTLAEDETQLVRELNPLVIQNGSFSDGHPTGDQSASLVSENNFINFCASRHALGAQLMNGVQSEHNHSCNSIPMGMIVAPGQMPSCRFKHPHNLSKVRAKKKFKIVLEIKKMVTGNFVNQNESYFSAPQQISKSSKEVIGHAHVVIQRIPSIVSTSVIDPREFVFFKGIDNPVSQDGTAAVEVLTGLPAGAYRLGSILTAANHQPVLAGVAQRGIFDDVVYFVAV